MLKEHHSHGIDDKGYLGEDSKAFVSFSQDFNDFVENKRRPIADEPFSVADSATITPIKPNEQIELLRASRSSKLKRIEEIDDEDFYDAMGDEEIL